MKRIIAFFMLTSVLLLSACSTGGSDATYKKITAKDAWQMMSQSTEYILLDVRTESEYKVKRIDGAILIPSSELKKRAEAELSDKDQIIFVYCQSGGRSSNSAKILAELGYTNVYDIGGINSWPYGTISG